MGCIRSGLDPIEVEPRLLSIRCLSDPIVFESPIAQRDRDPGGIGEVTLRAGAMSPRPHPIVHKVPFNSSCPHRRMARRVTLLVMCRLMQIKFNRLSDRLPRSVICFSCVLFSPGALVPRETETETIRCPVSGSMIRSTAPISKAIAIPGHRFAWPGLDQRR